MPPDAPPVLTRTSTPSASDRLRAHRNTQSAMIAMFDAYGIVKAGHSGSVGSFFKNAAVTGLRTMSTADRVSTGTGLAITAGVLIAGLATGGLAIPVLIGLGAGAWAIQKAISEIGSDYNRSNRNWLQRFPGASSADTKDQATFLTCEAGDALRRAIDHYRMMANTIIPNELKPQDEGQYVTCEDAINHVKALARFIHHGDKVRNYTLPVLDMIIFYMEQYEKLAEEWKKWEPKFNEALTTWFAQHPAASCATTSKHVCYAPNAASGVFPWKPHGSGTATRDIRPRGKSPLPEDAMDVADLIQAMKQARAKVVGGMHLSSTASWNYSAERPATARVHAGASATEHMQKKRLDLMIDAVWKQVDRPGYFARAGRRVEHWYTRHNKSEKVGAFMSELLGVGSIFLPFMKGAGGLTDIAKSAVSGSVSVTTIIADKIGLGKLKSAGDVPLQSGLLNPMQVEDAVTADIRGSGVTIQKIMPKVMLHFGRAAEAVKKLGENNPNIESCTGAFGFCIQACEIIHEMEKVTRYIVPCIGIVDVLCKACDDWAEKEPQYWRDMEAYVGEWIRDDEVHHSCRVARKKCYGAKHHKQGNLFFEVSNDPHNPL